MNRHDFNEKDWRLFKSKIAEWQESFMDRLNKEYIDLLSGDANASDKFWKLDRRIRSDKKKAGVQLNMSRSSMIFHLVSLVNEGAITLADLEMFSETLQETVKSMLGIQ